MEFDNNDSRELFIPAETSLDEVIANDSEELRQINGSFEAIADRMDCIIKSANNKTTGLSPEKGSVSIVRILGTRGMQYCPFKDCNVSGSGSNALYYIKNNKTGRELTINEVTSHLARCHHLLEKGNQYGISAKEFYEYFIL